MWWHLATFRKNLYGIEPTFYLPEDGHANCKQVKYHNGDELLYLWVMTWRGRLFLTKTVRIRTKNSTTERKKLSFQQKMRLKTSFHGTFSLKSLLCNICRKKYWLLLLSRKKTGKYFWWESSGRASPCGLSDPIIDPFFPSGRKLVTMVNKKTFWLGIAGLVDQCRWVDTYECIRLDFHSQLRLVVEGCYFQVRL